MKITLENWSADFRPWNPAQGRVYEAAYAFDSETTLIDRERPWLTPAYVLGAAFDGSTGVFVRREHVSSFFAAHAGVPVVMHRSAFDLAVIHALAPELDIYRWVDQHLAWDTQLLHRLYLLGTEGHTASKRGQSTLEHCSEYYLGIQLPKDVRDSKGNPVRLSYGQWLGRPPQEIEPVYLEYLAKDTMATLGVFRCQWSLLTQLLVGASGTWSYVSPDWLQEQVGRWGWQTHHIQLKASIVLGAITANGLTVDLENRDELLEHVQSVADELRAVLRQHGYLPGPGSDKALQEILRRLEALHPEMVFPRTATELYASSQEALETLRGIEPFVDALLEYKAVEKLRGSFLDKMCKRTLHASFDVLKVTGRTSSFGELNAQNLPRDDRVRSCFVPSEGHVLLAADYSTIELVTLAQAIIQQFGWWSQMAEAINTGQDLHRLVAARFTGKSEADVTSDERQKAKPVNFGKPGAMGHLALKKYAQNSYGVELSDAEVQALSDSWFDLFPEMEGFLYTDNSLAREVAELFGLTPAAYSEHTQTRKFLDHRDNVGREHLPHPILGAMCLKVLKVSDPTKGDGTPYSSEELDFFWRRMNETSADLPPDVRRGLQHRNPSPKLQKSVMRLCGRAGVFVLTGRLRANASYSARHNTIFQGLAADGAKIALWKLWQGGYRIVNFIHDEVLIEVPADSNLKEHAENIRRLMIEGMRQVVPDLLVNVEYAAMDRWQKSAKPVFDEQGRLLIWNSRAQVADATDSPGDVGEHCVAIPKTGLAAVDSG